MPAADVASARRGCALVKKVTKGRIAQQVGGTKNVHAHSQIIDHSGNRLRPMVRKCRGRF